VYVYIFILFSEDDYLNLDNIDQVDDIASEGSAESGNSGDINHRNSEIAGVRSRSSSHGGEVECNANEQVLRVSLLLIIYYLVYS